MHTKNETAALGVGAQNGGKRHTIEPTKALPSLCLKPAGSSSTFALIGAGGLVLALAASAAEARALLRAGGAA